jgi:hypothetical protein
MPQTKPEPDGLADLLLTYKGHIYRNVDFAQQDTAVPTGLSNASSNTQSDYRNLTTDEIEEIVADRQDRLEIGLQAESTFNERLQSLNFDSRAFSMHTLLKPSSQADLTNSFALENNKVIICEDCRS